ncbi:hypothetical protein [Brachyspira hampsonii]|nr:hypothetical protein [Brachyspira hampsonii]
MWKNSIKVWDRINLEKLRDFEIEIGNKEGELEANKKLYDINKDNYNKNKQNQMLVKKHLFYLISYLSIYLENLIRLSKYEEASKVIISNIDEVKSFDSNSNASIVIADSILKVIMAGYDKEVLWGFIKTSFNNEYYYKTLHDNFIKCAEYMNDLEMKEKVLKEIK